MTIQEILGMADKPQEMIEELKGGRTVPEPDIELCINAINPHRHKVFDPKYRPDKKVKQDDGTIRIEKVARIALALQKLIVKRASAFLFGNPVELTLKSDESKYQTAFAAIQQIMEDVKIDSVNRRLARILFSCTEVAELWYPVEAENEENLYGINSKYKLKMKLLNPMKGDKLYPYFDQYDNLIAFSREYSVVKGDDKRIYFDVYTDQYILNYEIKSEGPVLLNEPKKNPIKKIPIVYGYQDITDYDDVQMLIERLEKLLSNFADTNDYHSSPKIFVKGKVIGFAKKGESGAILEGEPGSEASYLSWQHAPESVKLEIDTLKQMIYTISQTPDISFDNMKGLNSIALTTLKLMFLDAHLKVGDKREVFDEYLKRRMSIVKAYVASFGKTVEAKTIRIGHVITPYMIDDEKERLEVVMTATGNKPVCSQKRGVRLAGFASNPDEEYAQIQEEEKQSSSVDLFPMAQ